MKNKILASLFCGFLVLGMATGCTEPAEDNKPENKEEEKSKGNCEVKECMEQLTPDMDLDQANEIIGFEGEKKDDSETYVWKLTDKTKIEIEYKDDSSSIKATYDKEKIKNKDLKLSICYSIANNIKTETYTYSEMVEKLEGIEGNLEVHSATSKMYSWVNKDGNTFRATFSDSADGKCSIVSIR